MHSPRIYNSLRTVFLQRQRIIRTFSDIKTSKSFVFSAIEGKLETEQIFPYPFVLNDEQEDLVRQMVDPTMKFFEEKNDALKNDEMERPDKESLQGLKDLGAFGLMVPESYGGVGLNNTQYARLVEIVGKYDLGIGIVLGAHQSIGYKGIILNGTEEQKSKYLSALASGEHLAAYCLTEPSSGSDAMSIKTRAVKSADGSHYVMNGSKLWISNGGIADIFTVFAQTPVIDDKGVEKDKMTAFIVERKFGGISHSLPEKKMGIKCSNTAAVFIEDCKIPVENVLGKEGEGFKIAMHILNNGRFGMGAALSGTMRTCISKAAEHAAERRQFGSLLKDFAAIQDKIARMQVKQYVTESMAYVVAGNMDRGVKEYQTEAAISKVYSSEAAWYCCDEAIQILGGMGFMRETGLEKVMRDLRIFRIFEGTSEILRMLAVGMALKHIQTASRGASDYMLRWVLNKSGINYQFNVRTLASVVHPSLRPASKKLAAAVALTSEEINSGIMKYKRDIINQSVHLLRYADCIMEIYGMGVALSRATDSLTKNLPTAEHEARLAELACSFGSEQVRETLILLHVTEKHDMKNINLVSEEVCKNGGSVQLNPLGF